MTSPSFPGLVPASATHTQDIHVVHVVGAVIRDNNHRILCALRSLTMSSPGVWEFPGGKIEPGENPHSTLQREILEELGCHIQVGALIEDVRHTTEFRTICLRTYEATLLQGIPVPTEHAHCMWLPVAYLHSLVWAPADIPTVQKLQRIHHHHGT